MKNKLPQNFKDLFWWCKFSGIDVEEHKRLIIIQTINYGQWEHWLWLIKHYGKKELKRIIKEIPMSEFRPRALKLICLLIGIKKLKYGGVKIVPVPEIAIMKAFTLSHRGALKDYVDLYFILKDKHITLREIKEMAERKYKDEFYFRLFLEQLVY